VCVYIYIYIYKVLILGTFECLAIDTSVPKVLQFDVPDSEQTFSSDH